MQNFSLSFSFHSVSNEALQLFKSLTACGFYIFRDRSEATGLHRVPEGSFMKEGDSENRGEGTITGRDTVNFKAAF